MASSEVVIKVRIDARLFCAAYEAIERLRDQAEWDSDVRELIERWDGALGGGLRIK